MEGTPMTDEQILKGYDFVNDLEINEREDSDDNGHGTMVTGVLGARVNNGLGISGAVWSVKIIPVKVLNSSGEGTSEDVAKGIRYATDHGADIINMSFGGAGFAKDTSLSESITYAFKRNVVIVAAAGNDLSVNGNNLDENPVFPICDDNGQNMVIGVTALDYQDKKPSFANYGKNCVDVSAPGKRILSTIGRDPLTKAPLQDRYAFGSGTSLAAPLVSAQAVLLKTLYPLSTNRQIREHVDALQLAGVDQQRRAARLQIGIAHAPILDIRQPINAVVHHQRIVGNCNCLDQAGGGDCSWY
jgi:subtilisin family serine protease